MILFKSIKWKNFLSTGEHFVEVELNADPMTLIRGKNGEGKSIILDALCFALFGKAYRRINKGNLVNSINEKNASVELYFENGKKQYKVIRGIAPNVFEIYVNGDLINQDSKAKDYQKILEDQIVKMNYKSFTQIVILGSATFVPFMKLSSGDRRQVIEDILDIQIFSVMKLIVKDQQAKIKNEMSSLNSELRSLQEQISLIEEHIRKMQNLNSEYKEKRLKELKENENMIKDAQESFKVYEARIEKQKEKIINKDKFSDKASELQKLEHELKMKLASNKKERKFYSSHDDCPTCHQKIDENFMAEMIEKHDTEIKKLSDGLEGLVKITEHNDEKINVIRKIQSTISDLRSKMSNDTNSIQLYTTSIQKINKELSGLNDNHDAITKENTELEKHNDKIASVEGDKEQNQVKKFYNDILCDLFQDGGIKTRIIRQYLPIINQRVNNYLREMDFFIDFTLDEELNETIKSRYRDKFSYDSFSEGEKRRIDIALLLTWRYIAALKNSVTTNLLIMDEIFDSSLDQLGIDDIMKLFSSLEKTNLYVVSHRGDVLEDRFAVKLEVKKKNNFTQITKET